MYPLKSHERVVVSLISICVALLGAISSYAVEKEIIDIRTATDAFNELLISQGDVYLKMQSQLIEYAKMNDEFRQLLKTWATDKRLWKRSLAAESIVGRVEYPERYEQLEKNLAVQRIETERIINTQTFKYLDTTYAVSFLLELIVFRAISPQIFPAGYSSPEMAKLYARLAFVILSPTDYTGLQSAKGLADVRVAPAVIDTVFRADDMLVFRWGALFFTRAYADDSKDYFGKHLDQWRWLETVFEMRIVSGPPDWRKHAFFAWAWHLATAPELPEREQMIKNFISFGMSDLDATVRWNAASDLANIAWAPLRDIEAWREKETSKEVSQVLASSITKLKGDK